MLPLAKKKRALSPIPSLIQEVKLKTRKDAVTVPVNAAKEGSVMEILPVQDLKVIDHHCQLFDIDTLGTQCRLLNGAYIGSQIYQRSGRKIQMKSLEIQGYLAPAAAAVEPNYIRLAIVYDKEAYGRPPVYSEIFASQNSAGEYESNVYSFPHVRNSKRFGILYNKTILVGAFSSMPDQAFGTSTSALRVDVKLDLNGLRTEYNVYSSGGIVDIFSGSLYFFLIGCQRNAQGHSAILSSRLTFYDIE
jgi:hypothetical protein